MTLSTSFAETKQVWLTDVPSFGPDSDMTKLRSHSKALFLASFLQSPLEGALFISTHLSTDISPTSLTSDLHSSVCWHFPYKSHSLFLHICLLRSPLLVSCCQHTAWTLQKVWVLRLWKQQHQSTHMYTLGVSNLIKEISFASIQMISDLFVLICALWEFIRAQWPDMILSGLCSYKLTAIWTPLKTYVFFGDMV